MTDTPLGLKLRDRIRREGPISVAAYVQACLHDPEHGYYRRQPAIGAAGDFVTAPEISQVFGELIGLWCAVVWQQMGSPPRLDLVEFGPGRGTLMRDALRATRIVAGFHDALHVHLVESNAHLAANQRGMLSDAPAPLAWHATAADAVAALQGQQAPLLVVGNEFLDACPAEQYMMHDGHLHRRGVGLAADGALAFTLLPGRAEACDAVALGEGDILEAADFSFFTPFARLIAERGGAALFVDYGSAVSRAGDTLQAVRAHRSEDALRSPGEADLSFQVDFARFGAGVGATPGVAIDGPVPQAAFLGRLGIVERASRLMARNPDKAAAIEAQVQRLMAPSGMGSRFLAIGVRTASLAPLPGLASSDSG
jgi:SAM-dependent MidA family methyltransferase